MLIAALPFLRPLPLENYWFWLLIPLTVLIALVYKTIKLEDLHALPRQVALLSLQVLLFMATAGALLWAVVELAA